MVNGYPYFAWARGLIGTEYVYTGVKSLNLTIPAAVYIRKKIDDFFLPILNKKEIWRLPADFVQQSTTCDTVVSIFKLFLVVAVCGTTFWTSAALVVMRRTVFSIKAAILNVADWSAFSNHSIPIDRLCSSQLHWPYLILQSMPILITWLDLNSNIKLRTST